MKKQTIKFNIPANLHLSALVRNFSEELFCAVGFNKAWCSRLKLVVDELFMNAVRYGSKVDESMVYVSCDYDDEIIKFSIADEGVGSKKITAKDLKTLVHNNEKNQTLTQTSGRGLAMITSLWTDELNIEESEHGGILVTFNKKIESSSTPPHPPLIQMSLDNIKDEVSFDDIVVDGPIVNVDLHGPIDNYEVDDIVAPVYASLKNIADASTLSINLKEINYINSIFIGHLASWYNEINKKQGHIILKNTSPQVKDILDIVGLGSVIKIENK